MTIPLTLRLHLFLPALLLAATPCFAAHKKTHATSARHPVHKVRSEASPNARAELAAALAPERAKAWPARGFDALVQSLSLPLDHPASQKALQMLGTSYKWGGTSAEEGMDCSGYVWRSFKDALNVVLPRTARDMATRLQKILPHELRAGDLVFFNTRGSRFSHVGIYLGGAMFAHSPRTGSEARIDNLDHPYWLAAFDGARRAPSGTATSALPDEAAPRGANGSKSTATPMPILALKAEELSPKPPLSAPKSQPNAFSYAGSAAFSPQATQQASAQALPQQAQQARQAANDPPIRASRPSASASCAMPDNLGMSSSE